MGAGANRGRQSGIGGASSLSDSGRRSRRKTDMVLGRWGLGQIADASPGLAALAQNEAGAVLQATYRPGVCEGLTPSKNSVMSLKG